MRFLNRVKPIFKRVGAGPSRGYFRKDLEDAWRRYCPPPSKVTDTNVTSVTPGNGSVSVTDVTDVTLFHGGERNMEELISEATEPPF